jgi:hypothetical protein
LTSHLAALTGLPTDQACTFEDHRSTADARHNLCCVLGLCGGGVGAVNDIVAIIGLDDKAIALQLADVEPVGRGGARKTANALGLAIPPSILLRAVEADH